MRPHAAGHSGSKERRLCCAAGRPAAAVSVPSGAAAPSRVVPKPTEACQRRSSELCDWLLTLGVWNPTATCDALEKREMTKAALLGMQESELQQLGDQDGLKLGSIKLIWKGILVSVPSTLLAFVLCDSV